MAGVAAGKPVHYGAVLHYDFDRLRALFQALYVCRALAYRAGVLCRGEHNVLRQGVFAELYRRVHGGRGHRAGLHHFLRVCVQRYARHRPQRLGGIAGVELPRRSGVQYAGAGGTG